MERKDEHYGKAVRKKIAERGMTIAEFARRINSSRNNVYNIFKRKHINHGLLETISKVLNYDFLYEIKFRKREQSENDTEV